tara:strand:+ start:11733 stop:14096 length:2364 start_codon:yes stop_codon:yes gene_type:complete
MPKYLSGRQKRRPQDKLTDDRYQYLGLDQAEPNLSDPITGPAVPSGSQYQLVAVPGFPGKRYWVPIGGGLVAGAISVFDEGNPVSAASSITQLNFVGAAVTANVSVQSPSGFPGIAATITVNPVTISDNPPSGARNGELWWESDSGDLYVYYVDADSAQWVLANAGGIGDTGAKGNKGEVGTQGLTGSTGQKGDQGQKGEKGAVEAQGNKGQKGDTGATGDKGQKGLAGDDGADGIKGLKGDGFADKIFEGNTEAEVVDTGSDGHFKVTTEGTERFRINNVGSATFTGNVDIDGISELDDVHITGVTTFKNDVEFHGATGVSSITFDKSANNLRFLDNVEIGFGDGGNGNLGDLRIFHNGTESIIHDNGDGGLVFQSGSSPIEFRHLSSPNKVMGKFIPDGSVELYEDGLKRFETTTDGVKIYGGLQDKDGDLGTSGQVLSSTGTELNWVAANSGPQGSQGQKGDQGQKGEVGAQGPQGAQGSQGAQGDKGSTGAQGPQGSQGDKGSTGAQGPQGAQGPTGPQGTQGAQGAQGTEGARCSTGAQGPTGPQGPQGSQGTGGAQGPTGPQGVAGPPGPSGSATITNAGNDRVMTSVSGTTLNAESNLTFNGSTLVVSGNLNVTGTITGNLASFPAGTRMLFQQTSAPSGWTKDTSLNDRALRLVSGSVTNGGDYSFSGRFNTTITTGNGSVSSHTLTSNQIPSHYHLAFRSGNHGQLRNGTNMSANNYPGSGSGAGNLYESYNISASGSVSNVGRTSSVGSNQGHSHGFSNPQFNLAVQYTDVIIATKT